MTTLYAQPYDISANGFYFDEAEQYAALAARAINAYGERPEEFEIQFIDGTEIDCALAKAWEINQASFSAYLEAVEDWEEDRKLRYIIASSECGYGHDQLHEGALDDVVDIYPMDSLHEMAETFVDEGIFGEIPERLRHYIDYEAIARDLAMDYVETTVAGQRLVYGCR